MRPLLILPKVQRINYDVTGNGEVYSEYTRVGTKQHKKQENDQWRLLILV